MSVIPKTCDKCYGTGYINEIGEVMCDPCFGTGRSGQRVVDDYWNGGNNYPCQTCGGSGRVVKTVRKPCPYCTGGHIWMTS